MPPGKYCRKCKQPKSIAEFEIYSKKNPNILKENCKKCGNEKTWEELYHSEEDNSDSIHILELEKISRTKICKKCKLEKDILTEFYAYNKSCCKDCFRESALAKKEKNKKNTMVTEHKIPVKPIVEPVVEFEPVIESEPVLEVEPKEKACSKCNITKTLDEFYKQKDKVDGKESSCKKCRNIANANTYRIAKSKKKIEENVSFWDKIVKWFQNIMWK